MWGTSTARETDSRHYVRAVKSHLTQPQEIHTCSLTKQINWDLAREHNCFFFGWGKYYLEIFESLYLCKAYKLEKGIATMAIF